jgi:hypothetical protein
VNLQAVEAVLFGVDGVSDFDGRHSGKSDDHPRALGSRRHRAAPSTCRSGLSPSGIYRPAPKGRASQRFKNFYRPP